MNEQHARYQADAKEAAELESAATQTLVYSIISALLCFLPGPQIASIMRYSTARTLSKRLYRPVPMRATVGLILSIASVVLAVGSIGTALSMGHGILKEREGRIAELDKLAMNADAPTLSHEVACALAEKHAITRGFEENAGDDLNSFECSGELTADEKSASLPNFRFQSKGWVDDASFDITACFTRGSRWYVTKLTRGKCDPSQK